MRIKNWILAVAAAALLTLATAGAALADGDMYHNGPGMYHDGADMFHD